MALASVAGAVICFLHSRRMVASSPHRFAILPRPLLLIMCLATRNRPHEGDLYLLFGLGCWADDEHADWPRARRWWASFCQADGTVFWLSISCKRCRRLTRPGVLNHRLVIVNPAAAGPAGRWFQVACARLAGLAVRWVWCRVEKTWPSRGNSASISAVSGADRPRPPSAMPCGSCRGFNRTCAIVAGACDLSRFVLSANAACPPRCEAAGRHMGDRSCEHACGRCWLSTPPQSGPRYSHSPLWRCLPLLLVECRHAWKGALL